MSKTKIMIEFDSRELADSFTSWLCNQGEQDFFTALEYDDDVASKSCHFDYWNTRPGDDGEPVHGEFMADDTIRVTAQR